ncbi:MULTISPECIES: glycine zipper 2TM domain-containing protein [Modicisalibacter]|uniref:Glycine zipper 2TM domain-containing protein n=1 Tax=Modicisalibacter tunisiensis TaxID=390637 RepID=A0ABS7WZM2_9GAMM|nr:MULTISPECIES: glycine zipper 2TM domain-containing protein [Modicisalibacter]MBZ9568083.1 glycine zipper 2TM domain-containing protein [Modicisalibacter tunisiensis]
MNKSIIIGTTLSVLGLGGLAFGAYQIREADQGPKFAQVTQVDKVTQSVASPRQVCKDVAVTHSRPAKDPNRVAGTAVGAIVGGVVGNQFGGGTGKKLMTAAGAVAGGFAGREVQGRMQQGDTYTTTERRCHEVNDTREKVVGYDVEYRVDGQSYRTRLDEAPARQQVPLIDGQPQWKAEVVDTRG